MRARNDLDRTLHPAAFVRACVDERVCALALATNMMKMKKLQKDQGLPLLFGPAPKNLAQITED